MKENKLITNLIYELESNGFAKTVDSISEYSTEADLYFPKIGNNQFLVFNHYNKKRKIDLQGFDCWISNYDSVNDIGVKKANQTDNVQLSFQVDRDWHLIAQYLQYNQKN